MGITGYVYLFGVNLPITELLLFLSVIITVYLVILEYEFREVRGILRKFDDEELILTKTIRELRDAVGGLRNISSMNMESREIKPKEDKSEENK